MKIISYNKQGTKNITSHLRNQIPPRTHKADMIFLLTMFNEENIMKILPLIGFDNLAIRGLPIMHEG